MPLDIQGTLDNVAASLRIVPSASLPTEFGDPLSLKIIPSLSDLEATDTLLEAISAVPVAVPVALSVTWQLFRCHKKAKATTQGRELKQDADYLILNESLAPEVTFLFGLEGPEGLTCVRAIADIKVSALGQIGTARPEVDLLVPTLDVPVVAVFFRRHTFNTPPERRVVLVAVPMTAAAAAFEELVEVLRTLHELAGKVRRIRRFVRLLTGIDLMLSVVRRQNTTLAFMQADEIGEFPGSLGKWTTSMMFLGPSRARIECYVERAGWEGVKPQTGQLNVGNTSDPDGGDPEGREKLIVLIPHLGTNPVQVVYGGGGARDLYPSVLSETTNFSDCLRSARFVIPEGLPTEFLPPVDILHIDG